MAFDVKRRRTRVVWKGSVPVGGDHPVSIQSMTKTHTADVEATVRQIRELEALGCDIIRVAVPDGRAARALGEIARAISIPLVADIHFDANLALEALRQGVAAVRINPGNMRDRRKVRRVIREARDSGAAIRLGVNSGSIRRRTGPRSRKPLAELMVDALLRDVELLEITDDVEKITGIYINKMVKIGRGRVGKEC